MDRGTEGQRDKGKEGQRGTEGQRDTEGWVVGGGGMREGGRVKGERGWEEIPSMTITWYSVRVISCYWTSLTPISSGTGFSSLSSYHSQETWQQERGKNEMGNCTSPIMKKYIYSYPHQEIIEM